MLTDSQPIARCSRTSDGSYAVFMVLNAVALVFFALPPSSWDAFSQHAEAKHGALGRRAARFLEEHAPSYDQELPAELLIENLDLAVQARTTFGWAKEISEQRFFNDVLPYAVFDERREAWRADLLERCAPLVANCTTAAEAAQTLNREFFNLVNVHYNTKRRATNQSPSESIEQGMATCTGLSILLVDACRSVGVPARAAGVANWHDQRGNHTWVEIHDGQRWRFLGADEYDAKGLDRGWFTGAASKAIAGDPVFGVWATSWKPVNGHFTMAWNPESRAVGGEDVTTRYAPTQENTTESGSFVSVRVRQSAGGERMALPVTVADAFKNYGSQRTRAGRADMNDMPRFKVDPEALLTITVGKGQNARTASRRAAASGEVLVDLVWDEMRLTQDQAERLTQRLVRQRKNALAKERAPELKAEAFLSGDHTLKYLRRDFGQAPEGQKSLWISMHGGGGAPTRVNDQQWRNQIKLYTLEEGIYIAPRAPTDTWNLWHQGHIDDLFDRLIETFIATEGVDPNRVYLLGYSAGGDGVYQLAPRMADRFAAASMMAGHPNNANPTSLRNLPFAIFMGGEDSAYNRNTVARDWGDRLQKLQAADPEGYPHRCTIYEGLGHWMDGRDAEGLPWMAQYTRDPWPTKVVWHQSGRTHGRFAWLSTESPKVTKDKTITAEVDGQTIRITKDPLIPYTLRLSDALVDLDEPIEIVVNGTPFLQGQVHRTEAAIRQSLSERFDPASVATALVDLPY